MRSLLLLLFVLLLGAPCHAKRRRGTVGPNMVQNRKRECEQGDCKEVHEDDRGNCVLKCQSAACYEEIYMPEELEPGEIDLKRQRLYNACLTKEAREATMAYRRKPKAEEEQPTTAADADNAAGSRSIPAGGNPVAGNSEEGATTAVDSGSNQPQMEL